MPSRTGQQNLLASAANGSNCCCCCSGTWHFVASPAQGVQGEQAGSRQGAWLGGQSQPARGTGTQPANPAKRPGSRRVPTFLVPALGARQHKRARVKGPAGSSAPEKPEMGTTGKAPPRHRPSPGRSAGPPQLEDGSGGPRTPSISASGCLFLAAQLKPPFVPKLSPFTPAQPRAVGLTKRAACPLPTGGDEERHFYLQLEPDGLGKDSPPFHPDHWSTSKAAGAWPGSHERTQPVPSPVPAHQSPRPPSPGEGKEQQGRCWSLGCCPERAGRGEGPVTDFTRWA